MICGSFNYQRVFSVKYVVMDTSNTYCIVGFSLYKEYECKGFYLGSI